MVELLLRGQVQAEAGTGTGALAAPCPAAPFLELPSWLPSEVLAKGVPMPVEYASVGYDASENQELTDYARDICGDFFAIGMSICSLGEGTVVFSDPHQNGVTTFCIGPRVELLHKYYKAGPYLLDLIKYCPMWVVDPEQLLEYAAGALYGFDQGHALRPWNLPTGSTDRPATLPPVLTEIVDDIEACRLTYHSGMEYPDEFQSFPIGMATWYDNLPYQDKRTKRMRDYELPKEQGTSPAWIMLDYLGQAAMEVGGEVSCFAPTHDLDYLDELLQTTAKYIRLFKYLSHGTEENKFSCYF